MHIIGLIIQCCQKKLNTSSLYFFIFKFLEQKKLKCSDVNSFSLLFQIKFYFSNGKLLGIVYAISGKTDDDCSNTINQKRM